MAQEVRLPSGETYRFPDGMSQAEMISAIRLHLGPPSLPRPDQPSAAALTPTQRQAAALRSGEPVAIPGFEPGKPPSGQTTLDMTIQSLLTAGGMAAGAPAGPLGSMALGGAGAAGGKYASRWLGQQLGLEGSEYPTAGESTLDAVAGGAGPAVGAIAKPIVGKVSGVTREMAGTVAKRRAAGQSYINTMDEQAAAAKQSNAALEASGPFGPATSLAHGTREWAEGVAARAAADKATLTKELRGTIDKLAASTAKGAATEAPRRAGDISAVIMGVAYGDLVSAALLFGSGVAGSPVRVAAARRLLQNEKATTWLAEKAKGGITPARLLTSLSALAAVEGITPQQRRDIRTLQDESEGMRDDRDALERMMDGS